MSSETAHTPYGLGLVILTVTSVFRAMAARHLARRSSLSCGSKHVRGDAQERRKGSEVNEWERKRKTQDCHIPNAQGTLFVAELYVCVGRRFTRSTPNPNINSTTPRSTSLTSDSSSASSS